MDKKGIVIHIILFGILLALGIFFVTSNSNQPALLKGEWATSFLKENYLESQKVLLQNDATAKNVGSELALDLAAQGGFISPSECGMIDNHNLWNSLSRWCIPDISNNLAQQATQKFKQRLPGSKFYGINFSSTFFYGKGLPKTIKSAAGTYTFNDDFSVDLGYPFSEYQDIEEEARILVAKCSNSLELKTCLDENRDDTRWFYTNCNNPDYQEDERKVSFCVISPRRATLLDFRTFKEQSGYTRLVQYNLALDFSRTAVGGIGVFNVAQYQDTNYFQITFARSPAADGYNVYYTDWSDVTGRKGAPENVFLSLLETVNFKGTANLENSQEENCPATLQPGQTYLCNGKITYLISDSRFEPDTNYFFTVTTVSLNQESRIEYFTVGSLSPTSNRG